MGLFPLFMQKLHKKNCSTTSLLSIYDEDFANTLLSPDESSELVNYCKMHDINDVNVITQWHSHTKLYKGMEDARGIYNPPFLCHGL